VSIPFGTIVYIPVLLFGGYEHYASYATWRDSITDQSVMRNIQSLFWLDSIATSLRFHYRSRFSYFLENWLLF